MAEMLHMRPSESFKALAQETPKGAIYIEEIAEWARDEKILGVPVDAADSRHKEEKAREMLNRLSRFGLKNVQSAGELINVTKDPNSPDKDRAVAADLLYATSAAVFGAMRFGGNNDLVDRLGAGAVSIREVLPEPLYGIEDVVASYMVKSDIVRARVAKLEIARRRADGVGGAKGDELYQREADKALDDLMGMEAADDNEAAEIEMAMAYINNQAGVRAGVYQPGVNADPDGRAATPAADGNADLVTALQQVFGGDRSREYYEQQLALGEVQAQKFLDDALMGKSEQAQLPLLWNIQVPTWLEGVTEDSIQSRWILETAQALSNAVMTRRRDPELGTDPKAIKDKILQLGVTPEKYVKFVYEFPELGVKDAWQVITKDLFREVRYPRIDDLDGSGDKQEVKVYVFKQQPNGKAEDSVERYIRDSSQYKREMAAYLSGEETKPYGVIGRKICETREQAMVVVSMVCDLMELGGVFGVADNWRRVADEPDAFRVLMRPETKYRAKIGPGVSGSDMKKRFPEIFGGPWGEYLLLTNGRNPQRALDAGYKLGVIPDLLCSSILSIDVNLKREDGGGKIPLGEALMSGREINFADKAQDFYFGWKKDGVMAAAEFWMFISGKNKLEFRSNEEPDNKVNEWKGPLYNTILTLRQNGHSVLARSLTAAVVGASTGLWPFRPPALMFTTIRDAMNDTGFVDKQLDTSQLIIRKMTLPRDEEEFIMAFYGIDRDGMRELRQKIVDYDFVTNGTAPMFLRKGVQSKRGWDFIR